jgi:hypothetical protein
MFYNGCRRGKTEAEVLDGWTTSSTWNTLQKEWHSPSVTKPSARTPEFTVQRQRRRRRKLGDPGFAGQHGEAPRSRPAGLSGRRAGAHRLRTDQEPPVARASGLELEGCPRTYRTGRSMSGASQRTSSATSAAMPLQGGVTRQRYSPAGMTRRGPRCRDVKNASLPRLPAGRDAGEAEGAIVGGGSDAADPPVSRKGTRYDDALPT